MQGASVASASVYHRRLVRGSTAAVYDSLASATRPAKTTSGGDALATLALFPSGVDSTLAVEAAPDEEVVVEEVPLPIDPFHVTPLSDAATLNTAPSVGISSACTSTQLSHSRRDA